MAYQAELWLILQDCEYKQVWDKIYSEFHFNPTNAVNGLPTFKFHMPVNTYDISDSPIYKDDESINAIIKSAFIECMSVDDFMYALDWQHTCFRYNPRINTFLDYPVFVKYDDPIKNNHVNWEGYNVYFPKFYPNGDFYFFIAKNFRWGYLTHPWLKKVWIFGDRLMTLINSNSEKMGFVPYE